MIKAIEVIITVVLTSFYFFPFEFTFLPGVNTKMAMAAVGALLLFIRVAKGKSGELDKAFVKLSFIAVIVSICAFASAVINNTIDYTYASYIISMWVWLGGAYTVVSMIRIIHGNASIVLIANYLITVCVAQCIIALLIDGIPAFKDFVNRFVIGLGFVEMEKLNGSGRLYGIGCSLDVAGTRFAAILTLIAFITIHLEQTIHRKWIWLQILAFVIITVVGNMIARTTIIGVVMSLLIWSTYFAITRYRGESSNLWKILSIIIIIGITVSSFLYQISPDFRSNLRFGFEGFFSLVEKGHWETNSNNMLKNMIVFPETIHTWIIGDGYLNDPFNLDPNYIGEDFQGYYMQTDIGYIRFIFYFGLIGLSAFIIYFLAVTDSLMKRFKSYRWMFLMVLVINLLIWLKVSTDIFLVFAIFLCISQEENEEYEASIALPEGTEIEELQA